MYLDVGLRVMVSDKTCKNPRRFAGVIAPHGMHVCLSLGFALMEVRGM